MLDRIDAAEADLGGGAAKIAKSLQDDAVAMLQQAVALKVPKKTIPKTTPKASK